MADADDFNRRIIEEFRTKGGRVGGMFERMSLLLLHHTGAKSGLERINPLAYQRVATGEERGRIWGAQKAAYPIFGEYEQKAGRPIPVVVLDRA